VSLIYSWAAQEDLVPDGFNPASGLKKLKRKAACERICALVRPRTGLGNRRRAAARPDPVLIALYTGQRREDVVG
jgi:hypothetical protein